MADPITALFEIIGTFLSYIFKFLLYVIGAILVVVSFVNPFRIPSTLKNAAEDAPASLFTAAGQTLMLSLVDIPCFFLGAIIAVSWRCGHISTILGKEGIDLHLEVLGTFFIVMLEYAALPAFLISVISWRRDIVLKDFKLSDPDCDNSANSFIALLHIITDIFVYVFILPFPLLSWRQAEARELMSRSGSYDTKGEIILLFLSYLVDWLFIFMFLLGICGPRFFAGMRLACGDFQDKRSLVLQLVLFNFCDIFVAFPMILVTLISSPFIRIKSVFRAHYANYKFTKREGNHVSDAEKIGLVSFYYRWLLHTMLLAMVDFLLTVPGILAIPSLRCKNIVSSLWKIDDKAVTIDNFSVTHARVLSSRQSYVMDQLGLWFLDLLGIPVFFILQAGIRGSEARRAVNDPKILGSTVHMCLFQLLFCHFIDILTLFPLLFVLCSWRGSFAWKITHFKRELNEDVLPGSNINYSRHADIFYLLFVLMADVLLLPVLLISLVGTRSKSTRRLLWGKIPDDRLSAASTDSILLPTFEKHICLVLVLLPLLLFDIVTIILVLVLTVTPRRRHAWGIVLGTLFIGEEQGEVAAVNENDIKDISFSWYYLDDKRSLVYKHRKIFALFCLFLYHDLLCCAPLFAISCLSPLRIAPALNCLLSPSPDNLTSVDQLTWKSDGLCLIACVSLADIVCFPMMLLSFPSWRCSDLLSVVFYNGEVSVNEELMKLGDFDFVTKGHSPDVLEKHKQIFSMFSLFVTDLFFMPFVLIAAMDVFRLPLLCRVLFSDPFWKDPNKTTTIDDMMPVPVPEEKVGETSNEKSIEGEVVGEGSNAIVAFTPVEENLASLDADPKEPEVELATVQSATEKVIDPSQYRGGKQTCFCGLVTIHPLTILDINDRLRKHSSLFAVFLVVLADIFVFPFAFILFCSWRIGDLFKVLFSENTAVKVESVEDVNISTPVDVVCTPVQSDIYDWEAMHVSSIFGESTRKNKSVMKLFFRYLIDVCLIPVVIAMCTVPWEIPYLLLQLKQLRKNGDASVARYVKILSERLFFGVLFSPVVAFGLITVFSFWRLPQLVKALLNWHERAELLMDQKEQVPPPQFVPLTSKFPSNKEEVDTYYAAIEHEALYSGGISDRWVIIVVCITRLAIRDILTFVPAALICFAGLYRLPRIFRLFSNHVKRMLWMHGLVWDDKPQIEEVTGGNFLDGEAAQPESSLSLRRNSNVGPTMSLSNPAFPLDSGYHNSYSVYPYELSFYDPIHSLFCYHAIQTMLDIFPIIICAGLLLSGYRAPQAILLLQMTDSSEFRGGAYVAALSVTADLIFLFPCLFILGASLYRIPLYLYMVLKDIVRFSAADFSIQSEVPHVSNKWMCDCSSDVRLEPVYIMLRTHAIDSVLLLIADILATICTAISAISPMRFASIFVLSCQSTETNEHLITKSMLDSEWSSQHIFMAEIEKIEDALGELFMKRDENSASSLIERLLSIADRYTGEGASEKLEKLDLPTNKLLDKQGYVANDDNALPTPYAKSTYITRSKIAADIRIMHGMMKRYARDVVASYPHNFDLVALNQTSMESMSAIGGYRSPATLATADSGGNAGLVWRIARASELSSYMEHFWASVRDLRKSPPMIASLVGAPGLRERFFDLKIRIFCVIMAFSAVLDVTAILGSLLIILTVYRLPQMIRLANEVKGPDGIRSVVLLQTRALAVDIGYLMLLLLVVIPLLTRSIDTVGGAITDVIQKKPSAAIHARIWTAARSSILDWANLFAIISVREFVALAGCSIVAGAFIPAAMFYFVFKSLFCNGDCSCSWLISLITIGFTLVVYIVPTNAFFATLPKLVSEDSDNNDAAKAEATTGIAVLLVLHGFIIFAVYLVLSRSQTFVSLYADTEVEGEVPGSKKKKSEDALTHVNPLLRIRATMPNKLAILNLFIEIMQMSSIVFLVTGVPWSESMNSGAISFAKAVFFQDYQSAKSTFESSSSRRLEEGYLEFSATNFMGELGSMYFLKVLLLCIWFLLVTIPTVSERVDVLVDACCLEKREIGYYSMNPIVRNFCIFISGSMFLSICQTIFNTLACKYPDDSTKPYVSADPEMNCWSGSQGFWAVFMSLAFTFFLPTALLIGVYERSRKLRDIDIKFTEMVTTNAHVAKLGMAAAVAFSSSPSQALTIILILALAVVIISVRYKQIFKTDMGTIWEANTLHILSYMLCAWSCVAGLIAINIDDVQSDTSGRFYVYGLVIIFLVVFGYVLLRRKLVEASVLTNDDKFIVARLRAELELLFLCMPETLMKAVWRNKQKAVWLNQFAKLTTYVDAAKLIEAFAYQIRPVAFDRSCLAVGATAESNANKQGEARDKDISDERTEANLRNRANEAYNDGKAASSKLLRSVSSDEILDIDAEDSSNTLDPFLEVSSRDFKHSGYRYANNNEELPLPHPLKWWIHSLRSSEHPLQVLRKLRELEHSLAPEACLLCKNVLCAKAFLSICTSSFGNAALVDPLADVVFSKLGLTPQPRLNEKKAVKPLEAMTQKLKALEHSFLWGMDVSESRLGDKNSGGLLQFVQRIFSGTLNAVTNPDLFLSISKNFMSSFAANRESFVCVCNKDLTYDEARAGLRHANGIGWGNPESRPCVASVIHIDGLLAGVKASLTSEEGTMDMRDSVTATIGLWGGLGRHIWKVLSEKNYWSFSESNIVNWQKSKDDSAAVIASDDEDKVQYKDPLKGCFVDIDSNFEDWSYGYGCDGDKSVGWKCTQKSLRVLSDLLPVPISKEELWSYLSQDYSMLSQEQDARVTVLSVSLRHGMTDLISGLRSYLFPVSQLSGEILVTQSYVGERPTISCANFHYDDWNKSFYVSPLCPFWPLILRSNNAGFCTTLCPDAESKIVEEKLSPNSQAMHVIPSISSNDNDSNIDTDIQPKSSPIFVPPPADDFSSFICDLQQGNLSSAETADETSDAWTCSFCSTLHSSRVDISRTHCKNCYTAKPVVSKPAGQYWKCTTCNHFNKVTEARQRYCECGAFGGIETGRLAKVTAGPSPFAPSPPPVEKAVTWVIQLELKEKTVSIDQRMGYFALDGASLNLLCLANAALLNRTPETQLCVVVPLKPSQVYVVQGIVVVSDDMERGGSAKSADNSVVVQFLNCVRRRAGLSILDDAAVESKSSQPGTALLNLSGVGAGASSNYIDPDVVKLRRNMLALLMTPIPVIADHNFKNSYVIKAEDKEAAGKGKQAAAGKAKQTVGGTSKQPQRSDSL